MSSYSKSITPAAPPQPSRVLQKRSPGERERLLARFQRSGQSQKRFCHDSAVRQQRAGHGVPEAHDTGT